VALVPGHLPVAESPQRYFIAASTLERFVTPEQESSLWQIGVDTWPEFPELAMGLGNHWYRVGDFATAAGVFRRLVASHPDYAPAFNNLASALLELGQLDQALAAAQRAVELAGEGDTIYRQTLDDVRARRGDQHRPAH
jgi:tetratricopeptide (TPR) repeat protein